MDRVYGFFNRMSVELTGGYFQQYQLYSSEVDTHVFQKSINGTAKVDVDLTSRLSLFGQGGYQDVNYQQIEGPPDQDVRVPLNDRTAWGGRGGLRYQSGSGLERRRRSAKGRGRTSRSLRSSATTRATPPS